MSYAAESYEIFTPANPNPTTPFDYDDTNMAPDTLASSDDAPTADAPSLIPSLPSFGPMVNVGSEERIVSGVVGAALATYAIAKQRNPLGVGLALLGGYLIFRGASGYCPGYDVMRTSSAPSTNAENPTAVIPHGQGVKVEKVVTINRTVDELYDFWRNFENLPRIMAHLEAVTVQDDTHSHWVAKAPLGKTVEWDAVIINEIPGELIAWKSTENADVANTGSVRFKAAPAGRGTEVKVNLEYNPPAGLLGMAVAKLFGEEPNQQVMDDLRHFKALMETGEMPTNGGQPTTGYEKSVADNR